MNIQPYSPKRSVFVLGANEIESLLPPASFAPGSGSMESAIMAISNILGLDVKQGLEELFLRWSNTASSTHHDEDSLLILRNIRRWAIEGLRDEDLMIKLGKGQLKGMTPWGSLSAPDSQDNGMMTKASRSVTARQARCILANAFLGNCNDVMESHKDVWNSGGLDFRSMLRGSSVGVGLSKMECLLTYFESSASLEGTEDDERVLTFDLLRFVPLSATSVNEIVGSHSNSQFVGDGIVLHTGTMESPTRKTSAFVNFANPNYGYGTFIRSCTQEEILLMCCPELIVGMLFVGKMKDSEVVNVQGVRRYCKYSGYLNSFRCEGPTMPAMEKEEQSSVITTVLTLDACYREHFSEAMLWRDVSKAYYSFLALTMPSNATSGQQHKDGGPRSRPIVSTGKWGCGAFGGNPAHKMLQQAVAAAMAGVDLEFSCFGSFEGCDLVIEAMHETKPSVSKVISLLQCCKNRKTFIDDALCFLRKESDGQCKSSGVGLSDPFRLV